jgi:hypothetical protein
MRSRMRKTVLGLLVSYPLTLPAVEIVDRIVAVVGRHAITLSQAEQAMELRALRGAEPLAPAVVVERLIESYLIEREVRRYQDQPVPTEDVRQAVNALRESYPSEETFHGELASKGMTEESLLPLLRQQIAISRYLDRRFRPLVYVTEDEIRDYYEREIVPALRVAGEPLPELESVRDKIRQILVEKKYNERVDSWIESLKGRARIRRYVW